MALPSHSVHNQRSSLPAPPPPPSRAAAARRRNAAIRHVGTRNGHTPTSARLAARARAQLGRPRHKRLVRGSVTTHLQRGPRSGLVQPEEAACTHAARLSTPVSARGRGERVRGTTRERVVACGASAHTRPSANPNQGVQGVERGIRPAVAVPAWLTSATCTSRRKLSGRCGHGHHGHHGHP